MSDERKAVFLSYASQDAEAARRICDALRAARIEVWFDQSELRGGDAWDAKIRKQIATCDLFIPVISANTQARLEGYFRIEWKLAAQRTHAMADEKTFLLPVVVDETRDADAKVPAEFKAVQWTRLRSAGYAGQAWLADDEAVVAFGERVQALLAGEPGLQLSPLATDRPRARAAAVGRKSPRSKLLASLGLAAAAALGVTFALFFRRQPPAAVAPASASVAANLGPKSIAVLPFDNISEDPAASLFFADGVHEDILTNLALIKDLRVVSRSSVMPYRGQKKSLPEIARELGVAYVLEGSVRRFGNKVRVTGQLIKAATDEHVWADNYDKDLTDVFLIQSQLAQAIASQLRAVLLPQEKALIERQPTRNLEAYDLYQKSRDIWRNVRLNTDARLTQLPMLERAVTLDPGFASAWSDLSQVHIYLYGVSNYDHTDARRAKAGEALARAVQLAPDAPDTILSQGYYHYLGYYDYDRAASFFQKLVETHPSFAEPHRALGAMLRRQGRWREALASFQKGLEMEPGSFEAIANPLGLLMNGRRYDEARALGRVAAQRFPNLRFGEASREFHARGSLVEGEAWLAGLSAAERESPAIRAARARWAMATGNLDEVIRVGGRSFDVAVAHVAKGQLDAASEALARPAQDARGRVEAEPANSLAWAQLAEIEAVLGHKEEARRAADRAVHLMPETLDRFSGPERSASRAFVLAWTGEKDRALAEYARLLQVPCRLNVHEMRRSPEFHPLHGDPRFEALLNDPKNNAPLF